MSKSTQLSTEILSDSSSLTLFLTELKGTPLLKIRGANNHLSVSGHLSSAERGLGPVAGLGEQNKEKPRSHVALGYWRRQLHPTTHGGLKTRSPSLMQLTHVSACQPAAGLRSTALSVKFAARSVHVLEAWFQVFCCEKRAGCKGSGQRCGAHDMGEGRGAAAREVGDAGGERRQCAQGQGARCSRHMHAGPDGPEHTRALAGALPLVLFRISAQPCVLDDSFIMKKPPPLWKCLFTNHRNCCFCEKQLRHC